MHCTDQTRSIRAGWRRSGRRLLCAFGTRRAGAALTAALAAAFMMGCASRAPESAAPAESPGTAPAPHGTALDLPAPAAARNWEEFRRNAGRRLVAAYPQGTYTGRPPEILLGIPVIETELYVDGTIKRIRVLRSPSDASARDTVQIAVAAIRRAAPYGDMSRLSRPWKWVEVFLFNDQRQFKPRSLDE